MLTRRILFYLYVLAAVVSVNSLLASRYSNQLVISARQQTPDFMQVFELRNGSYDEFHSERAMPTANTEQQYRFALQPLLHGHVRVDPANKATTLFITSVKIEYLFGSETLLPARLASRLETIQMLDVPVLRPEGLFLRSTGLDPAFRLMMNQKVLRAQYAFFLMASVLIAGVIYLALDAIPGKRGSLLVRIINPPARPIPGGFPTSSWHRTHLVYLMLVACAAVLVTLIDAAWSVSTHGTPSLDRIIKLYQPSAAPEPEERFIFVSLAVLLPLLAFGAAALTNRVPISPGKWGRVSYRFLAAAVPWLAAGALLGPFFGSDFVAAISGLFVFPIPKINLPLALALMAACAWCWHHAFQPRRLVASAGKIGAWPHWMAVLALLCVHVFSWRWVGFDAVDTTGAWSIHVDSTIHALSQVVAGKTILVDLPSQYGMFPEMLAPVFRLTGFSVLAFTSLMALMQIIAMVALYSALRTHVRITQLRVMALLTLYVVTFETVLFFSGVNERYFQYWPIRFFWPAVSVWLFCQTLSRPTLARSSLLSAASAIGLLWNLDSGLFIVVAYGAYLSARLAVTVLKPYKKGVAKLYVIRLAVHATTVVITPLLFFALLRVKAAQPLNYDWLFGYQKVFYEAGFAMLPMPPALDSWSSVLGVYLIGLVVALDSWFRNPSRQRADIIFYLSMLGLGLFFYYQGRSHILNLITVCWPAVMIVAMLGDEYLRAIRVNLIPRRNMVLPAAGISMLMVCCYGFVSHLPTIAAGMFDHLSSGVAGGDSLVSEELAFIKSHAGNERECLLVMKRQGIYYAETGLASPVKGPGMVELLLATDEDNLQAVVASGKIECLFVGLGALTASDVPLDPQVLRTKYRVMATNAMRSVQYLEPVSPSTVP
ncbi:MAG: hypothetical protein EOO28_36020 [Comamonadaceae bacterium]|nr:MAG: hypothetical protein EOO28_36020 [Comamonadaceae bacterium]